MCKQYWLKVRITATNKDINLYIWSSVYIWLSQCVCYPMLFLKENKRLNYSQTPVLWLSVYKISILENDFQNTEHLCGQINVKWPRFERTQFKRNLALRDILYRQPLHQYLAYIENKMSFKANHWTNCLHSQFALKMFSNREKTCCSIEKNYLIIKLIDQNKLIVRNGWSKLS